MTPSDAIADFEQLYSLKQFVDQVRQHHVVSLKVFQNGDTNGFKLSEATPLRNKISISSTATCIGSLVLAGAWGAPAASGTNKTWWIGKEVDYLKGLLKADWTSARLPKNNPFTVAFVLEATVLLRDVMGGDAYERALRESIEIKGKKTTFQLQQDFGVESLRKSLHLDSRAKNAEAYISVLDYPPSAYLTQLAARALKLAKSITENECDRVADWAAREINTQISLIQAQSKNADALQLIYSAICLSSYRSSVRETPNELELIRYALKLFFQEQKPNGGWPQSRPLFHYATTGSAYCYDFEALAQLFLCETLYDLLFEFLPQITAATFALDRNKFRLKTGGLAWASDHHPQRPGPESWSSASVYLYLFALDRFLAEGIRRAIAHELEIPYSGVRRTQDENRVFAPRFLDCPRSAIDQASLKEAILKKVAEPLKLAAPAVAQGQKLPDNVPVSAILFGPPGTSKTEIVDQISDFIGWPAFTVDPSYFVRNGLDAIQAQANKVFRMLSCAEEIIVLFDEFDEMVRNRESADEILSRFLTTTMLPKLARINKQRRIIFIVATNYIESFDVAISRAGRFDFVIQMMPPTAAAKLNAPDEAPTIGWARQLKWLGEQLDSEKFESDLRDLTFLETKALVAKILELKTEGGNLTEKVKAVWERSLKSSTLRRLVKEESKSEAKPNEYADWKNRCKKQVSFIRFDE